MNEKHSSCRPKPSTDEVTHLEYYDYYLPDCDIAQNPIDQRQLSRLLILDCDAPAGSPRGIQHRRFHRIVDYFEPGDCLVLNQTRVIPARLRGFKTPTGGAVEVFVTEIINDNECRAMLRPGRRLRTGSEIAVVSQQRFEKVEGNPPDERIRQLRDDYLKVTVSAELNKGDFRVRFGEGTVLDNLHRYGSVPLPPYVTENLDDFNRYQTVYATEPGSVAAPTAGLHFTESLLEEIRARGVDIVKLTLHVGEGTFQPVRHDDITRHQMHSEYCEVTEDAAASVRRCRDAGKRVFAVGTTAVRALETAAQRGKVESFFGETELFIYPGYRFKAVDALLTNFHLPRSTLLMLVSAFIGRDRIFAAYREARRRRYRFYSFGDAMLLLPQRGEHSV